MTALRGAVGGLLVAGALMATVPAALAQQDEQEGRPVVGGGSFVDAPLLEAGTYRDSLLPDEQLYYAISLQGGQTLRVQATTEVPEDGLPVSLIQPLVFNPLRSLFCCVGESSGPGSNIELPGSPEIDISTEAILPRNQFATPGTGGEEYAGPGTYYVAFNAVFNESGQPPRIEIPLTFTLSVQGTPNLGPPTEITPDATGEQPERPDPSPSQRDANAGEDESAAAIAVASAVFGVLGLLAGGGLGYALRRLSARPTA